MSYTFKYNREHETIQRNNGNLDIGLKKSLSTDKLVLNDNN